MSEPGPALQPRGRDEAGRDDALRDGVALTVACVYPAVMTWLYFVALHREEGPAHSGPAVAYGIGKAVQFLFPILFVALCARGRLRMRGPTRRDALIGLTFGLAVGALVFLAYFGLQSTSLLRKTPALVFGRLQGLHAATPGRYLALALFYTLVHSGGEEYYWRWFVFGGLRRYFDVWLALGLSSLGFTLHHAVVLAVYFPGRVWTVAIPLALCVGIGGAVWCWLYHTSGSLYAPWLSHALIDAALLGVGYLMLLPYF